jgi:hypothetical protein
MVHEYVEDAAVLFDALQSGHAFVPRLVATAACLVDEAKRRGLVAAGEELPPG